MTEHEVDQTETGAGDLYFDDVAKAAYIRGESGWERRPEMDQVLGVLVRWRQNAPVV